MVKRIPPPMSNETITLVKRHPLIYVLASTTCWRRARHRAARLHDHPFIVAAVYLIMTLVLTWLFQRLRNAMPFMTEAAR